MAYMDYMGFKSYFTGEDWETTLTEGNEAVADETSSIFSETSSPETSEECQGSDEKSRNQNLVHKIKRLTEKNQCLEVEIKNLKESYEKQLETKTAEVKHFAKCLEKQEERHQGEAQAYSKQHKCLQRKIDELTKSVSTMKSEKQKMEGINAADLKSKQKQLDDYSKRLLEERTKSTRLDQDLKHYMSRLSNEETKSKKLEEELRHYFSSYNYLLEGYNTLRDNYNHDIKKMAGETDHLKSRLTKKDEELRVLREELKEKTTRLASAFEKRLKHDQRRVENTIDFNTPTDIEKDFSDFFDGERIDACDVIESILHSEEEVDVEIYYPRLACIIFVTAYEQVKEAKEAACDLFGNVTRWLIEETPRMGLELCVSRKKGEFSCHLPVNIGDFLGRKDLEISRDVLDGLVLSLKQTAHLCDLDCFENVVKEIVWERWNRYLQEEKTQSLPAVHASRAQEVLTQLSDYIKACIRLTWKMVTQLPPLQLEYKSLKFDKAVHKLARFQCNTSDQRFGETATEDIACYLWPALIEGGGRIIFPGEVFSAFLADYVYL